MVQPRHLATGILAVAASATLALIAAPRAAAPPAVEHATAKPRLQSRSAAPRPTPPRFAPRAAPARTAAPTPAEQPFVVRRILDTGGPIAYGHWFWDEAGVPAGPILITVDLEAQVLSIFRGGFEIGTAAITFGANEYPTPLGTFPILMKDADHYSSTYDNAPMPYTLRLRNDGISIHGTAHTGWEWASHGCVGLPIAFARKLFGATRVGDTVIITRGQRMATQVAAR